MGKKEQGSRKLNKKLLLVVLGMVIILLAGGAIFKGLVLNKPKETPQQITQKMVDYLQKDKTTAEDKKPIANYFTQAAKEKANKFTSNNPSESTDSTTKPVITVKSVNVEKDTATSTIEMSVWLINLPIQFKFIKVGDYFSGYSWKIYEIIGLDQGATNAGKKEIKGKVNEKTSIGGGFSIKISPLSDYAPTDEYRVPQAGMKFVALEMEYYNDTDKSAEASPTNLTIRDNEGHSYTSTYGGKAPALEFSVVVPSKSTTKGFITFEIPTNSIIDKAIYSNTEATATISF